MLMRQQTQGWLAGADGPVLPLDALPTDAEAAAAFTRRGSPTTAGLTENRVAVFSLMTRVA
jgi:hypothetical protein